MNNLIKALCILLADTYALYLKTQNYHWHVHGPLFKVLHELFEQQYLSLADNVDTLAERILTKGHHAPATFKEFEQLKTIKDGNSHASCEEMLSDLIDSHESLLKSLQHCLKIAANEGDEGTTSMLSALIESHEKTTWMLKASKSS